MTLLNASASIVTSRQRNKREEKLFTQNSTQSTTARRSEKISKRPLYQVPVQPRCEVAPLACEHLDVLKFRRNVQARRTASLPYTVALSVRHEFVMYELLLILYESSIRLDRRILKLKKSSDTLMTVLTRPNILLTCQVFHFLSILLQNAICAVPAVPVPVG